LSSQNKFFLFNQETQLYGTVIRLNEPVGVIGIVCPNDNTPLLSFVSLFAPAISRANSVVIVPNEEAPLPALDMYQIFDTSDLPGMFMVPLNRIKLNLTWPNLT